MNSVRVQTIMLLVRSCLFQYSELMSSQERANRVSDIVDGSREGPVAIGDPPSAN